MYKKVVDIFTVIFSVCIAISEIAKKMYRMYINNKKIYDMILTIAISISIAFIFILSYIAPKSDLYIFPSIALVIAIVLTDIFESVYKSSNSLFHFLIAIWIKIFLIALLFSFIFKKSVIITVYFILCVFYSLIANKKVAILANEINGSILTFIYTIIMHYKEKIALFFYNFLNNYATWEEKTELGFYISKAEFVKSTIEEIDFICGKLLILVAISVVSIMLLHLKGYWIEKYLNPILNENIDDHNSNI